MPRLFARANSLNSREDAQCVACKWRAALCFGFGFGFVALTVATTAWGLGRQGARAAAKKAIDAFFGSSASSSSASKGASKSKPTLLGTFDDARLTESSGIAASRRTPGVFWTHNDSGDGPYLFAIDRRARTLARFEVPGATNVDWEDIAMGPGADGKPALYVGDIGDNNRNRADNAVYRVPEPPVEAGHFRREARTAPGDKFPYRYPDGAHDAETLLIHPRTGEIVLVTKEGDGHSGVYAFPQPLTPDRLVTLRKIGALTFTNHFLGGNGLYAQGERMATGGDIAPDGRRVVIRTYLWAYEWRIAPGQPLADALRARPRQTLLPLTKQGEGIGYRLDGKAWLTTSEGVHAPLWEIPAPQP